MLLLMKEALVGDPDDPEQPDNVPDGRRSWQAGHRDGDPVVWALDQEGCRDHVVMTCSTAEEAERIAKWGRTLKTMVEKVLEAAGVDPKKRPSPPPMT